MKLNTIEEAIVSFKKGEPIILIDDQETLSDGSILIPADKASKQNLELMINHGNGNIYFVAERERFSKLNIQARYEQSSLSTQTISKVGLVKETQSQKRSTKKSSID